MVAPRDQRITLEMNTELKRALRDLTKALNRNADAVSPVSIVNYHDAMTLEKVRKALEDTYPGPGDASLMATDMISAMQNAGILFRERV